MNHFGSEFFRPTEIFVPSEALVSPTRAPRIGSRDSRSSPAVAILTALVISFGVVESRVSVEAPVPPVISSGLVKQRTGRGVNDDLWKVASKICSAPKPNRPREDAARELRSVLDEISGHLAAS